VRALVLGPQLSNIGNGVIAKGAVETIEQTDIDTQVVESSAYSYYLADVAVENDGDEALRRNSVGVGEFLDVDFAVFVGCVLYPQPLRRHLPLFKRFNREDVPLLFLGVGGNDYQEKTASEVSRLLRKCDPDLVVTRDDSALEVYEDVVERVERGIDNGFFIDDWHDPPAANREFLVSTVDKSDVSVPETDPPVVRPHHAPVDLLKDVYEGQGVVGRGLKTGRQFISENELSDAYEELERDNLFVSDNVRDYLFFYKNASELHTDRIHAAVPTLMYGNEVQFQYDTPRAELLEGLVKEREGFYTADEPEIERRKHQQVATVESFVRDAVESA